MNKNKVLLVIIMVSLIAGSIFIIRNSALTARAESSTEESAQKYYTSIQLEQGDNLWSIAEKYMTDEYASVQEYINEVKQINHLKDDTIHHGKYICVPYYSYE